MLNRTVVFFLSGFLMVTALAFQTILAQTKTDSDIEKNRAKVRQIGVGREARVEVKLHDQTGLKGYIGSATDDSFTVVDSKTGASQSVAFADVDSLKKPRNGLKPSTWIIIGAAAAAAIIISVTVLYPVLCDGGAGCN